MLSEMSTIKTYLRDAIKTKKSSYGRKSSFLKGKGVRKKGQISPVKNKKVGN